MFSSLKNKIREETGSDLSKFTSKITSTTQQKLESLRGRSRQGSSSSINSIVSQEGLKDDGSLSDIQNEEVRIRLVRIEAEFARKLDEKDKRILCLETEKDEAYRQLQNYKELLKNAEDAKLKLVTHQEDKEQIENLQTQELSKVKHLVLQRDKELEEKSIALKEANQQLEKLRSELHRLRRQEELLSDVQDDLESLRHSSARDLSTMASELSKSEEDRRHLSDLVAVFRERAAQDSNSDAFAVERKLLEQRLEEAHLHLADIKTSWSDKIASLETQVGRLSRQAAEEGAERRRAHQEKEVLGEKVKQLEWELECNRLELNNKEVKIKRLIEEVEEMSSELKKNKNDSEKEIFNLRDRIQSADTEIKIVKKNLENTESEWEKTETEYRKLKKTIETDQQAYESIKETVGKLEKELNEERYYSVNMQNTLARVTTEKNTALLRNAEISQQMELAKQDVRRQEMEVKELVRKLTLLEEENKILKDRDNKSLEQELRATLTVLEEQISDKNKLIKTLQLRLSDMKKTLQQELRTPTNTNLNNFDNNAAILMPSQTTTTATKLYGSSRRSDEEDVNFKYLKHVIIKFLTSREYEAQHLIRAVATLLKFSPEEEKLLHDTLEWRMSWFGSKPKVGNGPVLKTNQTRSGS
ncbi:golgin subfamily A member 1 [Onthophagus taurus]|uniref:golgin subfamily A member 1 n=1 Tax=Onthophagus taurus TaxID=166361 RepID=UPI0039BDD782